MGRHSEYSEERALAICERHAEGEALRDICRSEGMPGRATLYRWIADHPSFALLLRCAREELADRLGREIIEIADGTHEAQDVPVAKLRIDSRKWIAQTLLFKSFQRDSEHPAEEPVTVTINLDYQEPEPEDGQALPAPSGDADTK